MGRAKRLKVRSKLAAQSFVDSFLRPEFKRIIQRGQDILNADVVFDLNLNPDSQPIRSYHLTPQQEHNLFD